MGFGALWWLTIVAVVNRLRVLLDNTVTRRGIERVTGASFIALGVKLATTPPA